MVDSVATRQSPWSLRRYTQCCVLTRSTGNPSASNLYIASLLTRCNPCPISLHLFGLLHTGYLNTSHDATCYRLTIKLEKSCPLNARFVHTKWTALLTFLHYYKALLQGNYVPALKPNVVPPLCGVAHLGLGHRGETQNSHDKKEKITRSTER